MGKTGGVGEEASKGSGTPVRVITGPVFESGTVRQIGGAVRIPDKLFKVVLISDSVSARAFIVENGEAAQVTEVAIAVLEEMTGLRFFQQRASIQAGN
jgi:DNA/RNA endonuclease G (NUC1)